MLAFFFVYGRYRLPLLVPLAILAGPVPFRVAALVRARLVRPLAATGIAALMVGALVFTRPFTHRDSFFVDYNNLGAAYQAEGRLEDALAEFEKAVTVRPGDDPRVTEVSTGLALLFVRRGEPERAKRLLRDVLRDRPADEDLKMVLATIEQLGPAAAPTPR